MTIRTDSFDGEIDITAMTREEVLDIAVEDLTRVARERYLTDEIGERPFDFAEDLAEVLERVSRNVAGPAELFYGQEITTNVTTVLALLPEHAVTQPPNPDRYRASIDTAADTLTTLARDVTGVDLNGNSPEAFADDLAEILRRVNANLDGLGQLFAGQDITPKAELVADLIGTDIPDQRPVHRSDPIRLPLYIDSRFEEFGLRDQLLAELREISMVRQDTRLPADDRQKAAEVMQAMRDRFAADKAAYITNYTTAATRLNSSRAIHAPVQVIVIHDDTDGREIDRDPLTRRLHNDLVQATPVPPNGLAPAEHPGVKPADIARSYHARSKDHPTASPPSHRAVTAAPLTQMTHQAAGAGPTL